MTSKLGNNIIKLKRKLGIKGVYYEQRRNTKKSREENRHGDELEKAKKETALNNGYFIASFRIIDNKTFQIYEKVYLSTIFIVEQRRYIEKNFYENDISDDRTKYFGLKGANFIIGVSVSYELYFLEY